MAFLDDFDKKITSWGQGAIQKTKDASGTAKLSNAISSLENQKKGHFTEIGRLYYAECQKSEEFDNGLFTGVIGQYLSEIHRLDNEIQSIQEQINQIKGIMYCSNCKAEIPQNSQFCNQCGHKVEIKTVAPTVDTGKKCKNCNADIEEDQIYCTNCGIKIEKSVEEPVQCERICPRCSKAVEADQIFCTYCGTKLESESAVIESAVQEPVVKCCPSCGVEVEHEQRFCIKCGTALG